jgi:uncharacterized phage protein (TIGR01671 family)
MRDILFRGKRKDSGEWVEGSLLYRVILSPTPEISDECTIYFIVEQDFNGCEYNVLPESIGQYTGLQDINGIKIFEGDIVKSNHFPPSVVNFVDGTFLFGEISSKEVVSTYHDNQLEIVGNIFNN